MPSFEGYVKRNIDDIIINEIFGFENNFVLKLQKLFWKLIKLRIIPNSRGVLNIRLYIYYGLCDKKQKRKILREIMEKKYLLFLYSNTKHGTRIIISIYERKYKEYKKNFEK